MEKQAVEIIVQYGGEIYEDYSGRAMYSTETTAIVFDDDNELYKVLADVMVNEDEDARQAVANALRKLRTDNLGKGIIYY